MKIAIVGATGNHGTAALRALHDAPEVTGLVGIARRLPEQDHPPYEGVEWHSIDIAGATTREDAVAALTGAFTGVDAVIHLAWLIQPNDRRELLRRVNVEGTRHVAEAVAQAGVPHLVVASSVGAYSPDEARRTGKPPLRDESWPTGGIDSSHYSVDKAAQEQVLDEFEAAHPDITVTRLRPGLTFQGDAGSEIQGYFLGDLVPVQALRTGRLPALPVPKGIRLQAVHSDDLGRAYAAAVLRKVGGAFNICADDVLGPQQLADIIDHGRYLELPPAIFRAGLVTAHKAGAVPADAGWLDMGMEVPLMDNAKAREELDWRPTVSAVDAFAELLDGMIEGSGLPSPPLRPRDKEERLHQAVGEQVKEGADTGSGNAGGGEEKIPDHYTKDLLELYLSDHLTGATAGVNRIERMAEDYIDTPVYAELSTVADEIRSDRELLRTIIEDLGLARKPYRQAVAWVGERVGRLKLNGRVLERSPMTMLLEAEIMRSAVNGKIGGWETLREHAAGLQLDPQVFDDLIASSHRQLEILERVHAYARERALRDDSDTFWD